MELATFGGGCFWCTEAVFEQVRGVQSVTSGYAGGHVPYPTYEQVCSKQTGHAEVVQISFDPEVISYKDILGLFFATHDPTTKDRQGNDVGPQYRSVVFTHTEEQARVALEQIQQLNTEGVFPAPIVTEVVPFTNFFAAEDYHQSYFAKNPMQPYCAFLIGPKVVKFRQKYAQFVK